ncbi:alpha/beta hydrolase [Breznakiella homolactica]|uniref:Alpha/beta hydrolase n=1 Tax=Breznakiella homolactica TaxID=2798577 RepID=A0A7T7XJU2_9SPIR|nr:alpha/beta hydrolase [Breznakiella homolactica]QQO07691.1 alpha/beta hydrolase [Breznakiella homolactica]
MKQKVTSLVYLLFSIAILPGCSMDKKIAEANSPMPEAGEKSSTIADQFPLREVTYFWADGNMPSATVYPRNSSGYFDPPDFRPNMVFVPARDGVNVKGAVLLCAGGAFQVRAETDGLPVAEQFSELGYHSFIVNYRLRPYTQEEGALDLARAVRYVRVHAEDLGMDENNIAVIGFSAGGILCGELLLNFDGLVNGTTLDKNYVPDELDRVSADAGAAGMVYSFYGRLSVASTDVTKFAESNLPPTYFLYGSEETFRGQIEACARAVRQAGVPVESRILEGLRHGFGYRGGWVPGFAQWLDGVFQN